MPIKLRAFAVAVAVAVEVVAPRSAVAQLDRLRPLLEQRIAQHKGLVAVTVIDLETGAQLSIRGDEPVSSASVIKLPVLVELFHQAHRGPLSLSDPVVMLKADQRPGSGILQFLSTPHQLTVRDAATLMIILSDNTATNLVLDKVGLRNVNARMDSLGFRNTRIHAKVFLGTATTIDTAATRKWGFGVTTSSEMAQLLARLYRGELVSDSASASMVGILRETFDDWGIARMLPAGASVANKTGSLNASRHDCGIVFSKERDYVICVLTSDNQDQSWRLDTEARVTIADLTRITHEYLTSQK